MTSLGISRWAGLVGNLNWNLATHVTEILENRNVDVLVDAANTAVNQDEVDRTTAVQAASVVIVDFLVGAKAGAQECRRPAPGPAVAALSQGVADDVEPFNLTNHESLRIPILDIPNPGRTVDREDSDVDVVGES